jgi:hypothetical protein
MSIINYEESNMGSYNPYPGPGINPEIKQQPTLHQELNTKEKPMISMLINSVYYFIQCVFILKIKGRYRLVALHDNKVLYDQYYTTLRGGRIAFQKLFKDNALSGEIKAEWSHLYYPDRQWLRKKCQYLGL